MLNLISSFALAPHKASDAAVDFKLQILKTVIISQEAIYI